MDNLIKVRRILRNESATLGVLRFGGFMCTTLEDEFREEKVPGETRIPAGTYEVKLRSDSNMAAGYEHSFGSWHKGMLWLQDVPGFEYIYIHIGNDDEDTAGCILVGRTLDTSAGNFSIGASRITYLNLAERVMPCFEAGETVFIQIEDSELLDDC